MYYFFPNDLSELKRKIKQIEARVREDGNDMGDSCNQSAETYHDNAPYEEALRSFELGVNRLSDLKRIEHQARLISLPLNAKTVSAGTVVTILDLDGNQEQIFRIGSYLVFKDREISYRSPLAKLLIGAAVGDIREGKIGKVKKKFRILAIQT